MDKSKVMQPSSSSRSLARGGQFQKRNHALFQFRCRQPQHGIQRHGVGHVEFAGDAAAQRGQVRAAAEFLAEIVGEAADVGALGAGELEGRRSAPGNR